MLMCFRRFLSFQIQTQGSYYCTERLLPSGIIIFLDIIYVVMRENYLTYKQFPVNKNRKEFHVIDLSLKSHKPMYLQEVPVNDKKIQYLSPAAQNRNVYYWYKVWKKRKASNKFPFVQII